MEKIIFILFGAPGSGKGFLGECLISELIKQGIASKDQIKYISTGDLLREEVAHQTSLGLQIAQIITSGELVPDTIVDSLVKKALQKNEQIMFLDGYPRTEKQLNNLETILQDKPCVVVTIKRDTPEELILERVSKRRVCKNCKSTHSVDDGKCPKCGGESVIRHDDAVIKKRLSEYHNNTSKLWDNLLLASKTAITVDGKEDAYKSVTTIVSDLKHSGII